MSKVLCPGSFDPLTLGHIDIIKRCSQMFDEVIVLIGKNDQKKGMLSYEDRKIFAIDAFKDISNIKVVVYEGLLVDFAFENGIDFIVKGIRNSSDAEYENAMANINMHLSLDKYSRAFETLYLPSLSENTCVSSTLVRELLSLNLPIDRYVHNEELLISLTQK